MTPTQTFHALKRNEIQLIDIRNNEYRARDGVVCGSFHIERTILEWRLETGGEWRNPYIRQDKPVLLICQHGYSTQLAAATL